MLGAKDILIKLKGDNKDFKDSLNGADSSMGSFTTSMKMYGPAIAASFALGTAAVIAMSVKMAAAEEVVNRQTESILKSQGIMWGNVQDEVADYINELERLTAYGDTDLQLAFNRMSSSGLSYQQTMESMNMVTDIAYTRNIGLVAAADLVSKAYNGQASSLKRYGIVVEAGVSGAEALAAVQSEVNNNFADAADRTDTLEGKMAALNTQTDDFQEALGTELIPELSNLASALLNVGGSAEETGKFLGNLISLPVKIPRLLGEQAADLITVNKLRKSGIDTEEEMVSLLRLESENIVNMTEEEFNYKTQLLEVAGYHEKAVQLTGARNYGLTESTRLIEQQTAATNALLEVNKGITTEGEKQLTTMRQRAAAAQAEVKTSKRSVIGSVGGTSSMSQATADLIKSTYNISIGSDRVNPNTGTRSGL